MNRAERRNQIIDRIARDNPNNCSWCMAAYIDSVLPDVKVVLRGTEFEGKERIIAMRAYERA